MNAFSAGKRHVYDVVSMTPDVITTTNLFPYTTIESLSVLEIIKLNKSDAER